MILKIYFIAILFIAIVLQIYLMYQFYCKKTWKDITMVLKEALALSNEKQETQQESFKNIDNRIWLQPRDVRVQGI